MPGFISYSVHASNFEFVLSFLLLTCNWPKKIRKKKLESSFYCFNQIKSFLVEQLSRRCKTKVDLGIVIDGSESIGANNFEAFKTFVETLVSNFGVSDSSTRVSLIVFGSDSKLIFPLGQLVAYSQFQRMMSNLRYPGGSSRLDLAMIQASTMFDSGNGGRQGTPKILIVASDGIQSLSTGLADIKLSADKLRNNGVLIYTVSAGQRFDYARLREIAGDRSRTYIASRYDALIADSFLQSIASSACKNSGMFISFHHECYPISKEIF